jgi:hypothetical protein
MNNQLHRHSRASGNLSLKLSMSETLVVKFAGPVIGSRLRGNDELLCVR